MRSVSRERMFLLPFCALVTSACMQWTPPNKPIPEAIRQLETEPVRTRVTLATGERITYKSVRVAADSLREGSMSFTGFLTQPGWSAFGRGGRPVAAAEVQNIEVWKINPGRTALAIAGVGLFSILLWSNTAFMGGY